MLGNGHVRFGGRPRGKGPSHGHLAARPTQPKPAKVSPGSTNTSSAAGCRGGAGHC